LKQISHKTSFSKVLVTAKLRKNTLRLTLKTGVKSFRKEITRKTLQNPSYLKRISTKNLDEELGTIAHMYYKNSNFRRSRTINYNDHRVDYLPTPT